MIVGMELSPPKLWWDLFCSVECCQAVHGDERPEIFADAEAFKERTEVDLRHRQTTELNCFHCNRPLKLDKVHNLGSLIDDSK